LSNPEDGVSLSGNEPQSSISDEALTRVVRDAADGSESAWRELTTLYGRRVFAMARSRVHDDDLAEEITQSVFVTVATKLTRDGYAEQGRFEPWLFRITMNRVRDEFRRRKRHAHSTDPSHLGDTLAVHDTPVDDHTPLEQSRLREALEQLNESDRTIIDLRHQGQMSFKQISALLDEPVGTLLARHHRALKKLRTMLEPQESTQDDPGATS